MTLLSVDDTAIILGVSPKRVHDLVREKKLKPAAKFPAVFDLEEVVNLNNKRFQKVIGEELRKQKIGMRTKINDHVISELEFCKKTWLDEKHINEGSLAAWIEEILDRTMEMVKKAK